MSLNSILELVSRWSGSTLQRTMLVPELIHYIMSDQTRSDVITKGFVFSFTQHICCQHVRKSKGILARHSTKFPTLSVWTGERNMRRVMWLDLVCNNMNSFSPRAGRVDQYPPGDLSLVSGHGALVQSLKSQREHMVGRDGTIE